MPLCRGFSRPRPRPRPRPRRHVCLPAAQSDHIPLPPTLHLPPRHDERTAYLVVPVRLDYPLEAPGTVIQQQQQHHHDQHVSLHRIAYLRSRQVLYTWTGSQGPLSIDPIHSIHRLRHVALEMPMGTSSQLSHCHTVTLLLVPHHLASKCWATSRFSGAALRPYCATALMPASHVRGPNHSAVMLQRAVPDARPPHGSGSSQAPNRAVTLATGGYSAWRSV